MIPQAAITAHSRVVPWPTLEQVEQDLLLSRLIVEIANDDYLGDELVFRGGTCLHKLHAESPWRYSEDLDYVRTSAGGIGAVTRAVTSIGMRLGMFVSTSVSEHPKVYLKAPYESNAGQMRIKIEINTHERSPAQPLISIPHLVVSSWFSGTADVLTFAPAELVATKIRALFQRSKGRDLFDLWLAITRLGITAPAIAAAFAPYRPDGYTRRRAELNLREKADRPDFREDLRPLVTQWPEDYSVDDAAEMIITEVLALIP